jgi:hypothetical protein
MACSRSRTAAAAAGRLACGHLVKPRLGRRWSAHSNAPVPSPGTRQVAGEMELRLSAPEQQQSPLVTAQARPKAEGSSSRHRQEGAATVNRDEGHDSDTGATMLRLWKNMLDQGSLTEAAYLSMCSEYARACATRQPWVRPPSRVFSGEEPEDVSGGNRAASVARRCHITPYGDTTRTHSHPVGGAGATAPVPSPHGRVVRAAATAPGPPTIRPLNLRSFSCPPQQRDDEDDGYLSPAHGCRPPPPSSEDTDDSSDSDEAEGAGSVFAHATAHGRGQSRQTGAQGAPYSLQARAQLRATLDKTLGAQPLARGGGAAPPPVSPHLCRSAEADAQLQESIETWLAAAQPPGSSEQRSAIGRYPPPTNSSEELADALADHFFSAATDSSDSDEDE